MAKFARLEVYNQILSAGLVPLFFNANVNVTKEVAKACLEGGTRVLEFTNRGEGALQVFAALNAFIEETKLPVILGVGSVIDAPTAALFIAHGANFIVSPILNPEVARLCNRRKIAYMPGCATVTEISQAEELGVEIVKIFPGETIGGPNFVKAVLAPCPWTRIMPTGGVDATQENIFAWFKAGAVAVGMGSNLIRKDLVEAGDYQTIGQKVSQVLEWIKQAKAK